MFLVIRDVKIFNLSYSDGYISYITVIKTIISYIKFGANKHIVSRSYPVRTQQGLNLLAFKNYSTLLYILNASFKISIDAFLSLSCFVPHTGHIQKRSFKLRSFFIYLQT